MKDKDTYEQWVIIPFFVEPNGLVQIDHRLPANAKICTGVAITLSDITSFYIPNILGEFSLLLNDRTVHPINFQAEWKPWRFRMDYLLTKIEEPLQGGTRITGYYYNHVPLDYGVRIYLQCISERNG